MITACVCGATTGAVGTLDLHSWVPSFWDLLIDILWENLRMVECGSGGGLATHNDSPPRE